MPNPQETFQQVASYARETALLESIESLLGWDERTMLPAEAGEYRAEQISYLSGMLHRRRTDQQFGDRLAELAESPLAADHHSDTGATIFHLHREFRKQTRLPTQLVQELARTAVLGQQAWVEARKKNDYAAFRPWLDKMIHLKRQQAEAIGYAKHRYDALLDDFEPGATTNEVNSVLDRLREQLLPLVSAIASSQRRPPRELLQRHFPRAVQETIVRRAAELIGFDFRRGRLDVTPHPFCTSVGPNDCRITTHYDDHNVAAAFFGTLHEAGHGLYDQGLRGDYFGMAPGMFASLGIHESQSRLWENLVGRSRGFWQYYFGPLREAFPESLGQVQLEDFYFALNDVRPTLIRVQADEATYNLHIIIRFQLEQELLNEQLSTADLPEAWRHRYHQYLGIAPSDDASGVMQDIHWSAGLFGYFPTYSLGNVYAAQFFEAAEKELGPLQVMFVGGQFRPLLDWLRRNIHQEGRRYTAPELVQRVTGKPLSHEALMRHLRAKFRPLYGIN